MDAEDECEVSNRRPDLSYGCAFAAIAVALGWMACRGGGWLIAVWPAVSFACVSGAYLRGEPAWFGKRQDGTRGLPFLVILGPYLALVQAAWRLQVATSREPAWNRVNAALIVGRRLRSWELPEDAAIVCDLTCEFGAQVSARYVNFPILDAAAAPPAQLLAWAKTLAPREAEPCSLLVHCAQGHGRTGMFAAVWLVVHGYAADVREAIADLKAVRPGIRLRSGQREAAEQACLLWESERR